jgi:hypothetical protein
MKEAQRARGGWATRTGGGEGVNRGGNKIQESSMSHRPEEKRDQDSHDTESQGKLWGLRRGLTRKSLSVNFTVGLFKG